MGYEDEVRRELSCSRSSQVIEVNDSKRIGNQGKVLSSNVDCVQPFLRCSHFINEYVNVNYHFLIFARSGPTLEDLLDTNQLPRFSLQEICEISSQIIQATLCKQINNLSCQSMLNPQQTSIVNTLSIQQSALGTLNSRMMQHFRFLAIIQKVNLYNR